MNAPTTFAVSRVEVPRGIPSWERYRPALDFNMPGCSEDEVRYRCGIMLLRDWLQRRLAFDHIGLMRPIWANACELALCPMTVEQLADAWGALGRMCQAARTLADLNEAISTEASPCG